MEDALSKSSLAAGHSATRSCCLRWVCCCCLVRVSGRVEHRAWVDVASSLLPGAPCLCCCASSPSAAAAAAPLSLLHLHCCSSAAAPLLRLLSSSRPTPLRRAPWPCRPTARPGRGRRSRTWACSRQTWRRRPRPGGWWAVVVVCHCWRWACCWGGGFIWEGSGGGTRFARFAKEKRVCAARAVAAVHRQMQRGPHASSVNAGSGWRAQSGADDAAHSARAHAGGAARAKNATQFSSCIQPAAAAARTLTRTTRAGRKAALLEATLCCREESRAAKEHKRLSVTPSQILGQRPSPWPCTTSIVIL